MDSSFFYLVLPSDSLPTDFDHISTRWRRSLILFTHQLTVISTLYFLVPTIDFHNSLLPFTTLYHLSRQCITFHHCLFLPRQLFTFHDSSFTYPSYLSTIMKSITRISWTNVVPPCVPASVQSVDFFSQHPTVTSPQSTASNNIYNNIRSRILQLYSLSRHYSTFHASVLHFTTIYYLSRQFISVHDSLLPFMTVSYLF